MLSLLCCLQLFSQTPSGCYDTSYVRYLQFDIWDWWRADSNNRLVTGNQLMFPHIHNAPGGQDVLQYNFTSNPNGVKVVGLSVWEPQRRRGRIPPNALEYLYLYDAQAQNDEFTLLAQVPWSPLDLERLNEFQYFGCGPNVCQIKHTVRNVIDSMYDYYFDAPITVYDSFYVGCSSNSFAQNFHGIFRSGFPELNDCDIPPILWKIYNHTTTSYTFYYPTDQWTYANSENFLMVLPIIEVIDSGYVPPCEAPRGVSLQGSGTDTVTLRWTDDSRFEKYVVHYCVGEFSVDNVGQVDTVYTNQWVYAGPDHSGEVMQVYVCGICNDCDSVREGDRSAIKYFVWSQPEQTSVPENDEFARHVRLNPNPAKDAVSVISASMISSIEVYNTQGHKIVGQEVGDVSASIDVSAWPHGVYVVLLHTAGGTVSKRLVVE